MEVGSWCVLPLAFPEQLAPGRRKTLCCKDGEFSRFDDEDTEFHDKTSRQDGGGGGNSAWNEVDAEEDGTYQVVREYTRDGERVRYYSLERGAWEEIPASMIDWEATEKTKTNDEKTTAALVDKVHKQEESEADR